MKKLLLLSLALGFGIFSIAQKAKPAGMKSARVSTVNSTFADPSSSIYSHSSLPAKTLKKSVTDITIVPLTSSINILGSLVAEQTCLSYNKDLNAIMHTSRSNLAAPANGNNIVTNISLDGGTTWTPTTALADGNYHRYPSGVFYNPAGNTTFTDAYSLIAGPRVATTGGWSHNYYSSLKLDGTNINTQYRPASGTGDLLERDGLTCNDDGIAHIAGVQYVLNSSNYVTSYLGDIRKGVFNTETNSFDWTEQEITPDMYINTNGTIEVNVTTNLAWSQDGQVGYFIWVGVDNRPADKGSYAPVVYKTTDAGENWEEMDYVDYTNNPVMSPYLASTHNPDVIKPFFWELDAVVDANDDLHMFAKCVGSSSENPDSAGYLWQYSDGRWQEGAIFEVYTEGNNWNVTYIDTLMSSKPSATGYTGSNGEYIWDMRLQASRSADGRKIFATWTDTDPSAFSTYDNVNPDLWAWGRDIFTPFQPQPKNFTGFTDAWGSCFYSFTSPICMDYPDETNTFNHTYEIPVMFTDIHTNFNPDLVVYHKYLQGVKFPGDYFSGVGIKENTANNMLVSQNVPNPFSGTTKVEVNLLKTADLSLGVYNLTGQKVYEIRNGSTPAGIHTFNINAANLTAGVYYYTVKAGENIVTKKMIVK
jgi:hypothetical protein